MDPIITPASAQSPTGPGKEAATAPVATTPAEPAKAKTPDLADKFSNPKILAVLKKREAAKAAAAPSNASVSPAPVVVVKSDAPQATPPPEPKPGDDSKPTPKPDAAEVIDLTQLGKETPGGDDTPPSELTGADALDLEKVKAKLSEAHKDSAAQRKLKREAAEKATQLAGELKAAQAELEALKQTPPAPTGRYLDRFTKVEEVNLAHQDALEAIKQLTEDPEREDITLSGNRVWKLVDGEGKSLAAQAADTALEILESYDTRVKQLTTRGEAEKLVTEKLPLLTKAIPDFEKRYKTVLDSDWSAQGPSISLNAAVGELVTSGAYVLTKAGKPDAKPAAQPPAAEKAADLPSTTPPVRPVESGKPDTSELRARAMDPKASPAARAKALKEWIAGGKPKAA